MSIVRFLAAFIAVGIAALALPDAAHAWTPGTHVYIAESVLANLNLLPAATAELLRAFPFDFLYGNIAADASMAKRYAPVGRHCHYWHVGREIHEGAPSDALRAFGLGYLSHLAADVVAHNHFVPRQLLVTSTTSGVGHSYWETRIETHLGDAYARLARDVILLDHRHADSHLDRIIAPTIFSVRTNRRIFRGMVHITEMPSWQRSMQVARDYSRWPLSDMDVERHLARSFENVMELLHENGGACLEADPSGEEPLKSAKVIRRELLRDGGRREVRRLHAAAEAHYGLPRGNLHFWDRMQRRLPWSPADELVNPTAVLRGRRHSAG